LNFVTAQEPLPEPSALLCLRVTAEADPGALSRVLEPFQNSGILLRRVIAEFGTNNLLHIQIDISGLPPDRLTLIAAKLTQMTSIHNAYWSYP